MNYLFSITEAIVSVRSH